MQKFLDKKDLEPILLRTNKLILTDIKKLDGIISKYEGYGLIEGVNEFSADIMKAVFPTGYKQLSRDFVKMQEILTYAYAPEYYLRNYFITLMKKEFEFDPLKKHSNLTKLSKEIIHAVDSYIISDFDMFKKIAIFIVNPHDKSKLKKQFEEEHTLSKDEIKRATNAFVFFAIRLLISGIILSHRLEHLDNKGINTRKIQKILSKIYYGYSLGKNQFELLRQNNLLGGILFRGFRIDYKTLLKMVTNGYYTVKKQIKIEDQTIREVELEKGTAWSADYNAAVWFAMFSDNQMYAGVKSRMITSFEQLLISLEMSKGSEFMQEYKSILAVVDRVSTIKQTLEFIVKHSEKKNGGLDEPLEISGKEYFVLPPPAIPVILSCPIDPKGIVYLKQGLYPSQKEVVMLPKKFELIDNSIDAKIYVMCKEIRK